MFGKNVDITAPGKLVAMILVIFGDFAYIIIMAITGNGDATPAWAMLTLVVGYLIGNGSGARRGIFTVPPLSPSPQSQISRLEGEIAANEVADDHG